ncbi:hypothetical protein CEB3_c01560 [Peptococcaceae bacterium CEB3]|nr:hypothetical protein CEB3_c01560 [Peptococcaceae bacterium CEB3]
MMRDARAHLFDLLVIKDFSRFPRNTLDFLVYFRELKELGIKVVFTSFGMRDMTEVDEFKVNLPSPRSCSLGYYKNLSQSRLPYRILSMSTTLFFSSMEKNTT